MLILPRVCPCCECALLPAEQGVCLRCLALLPRVHAENPGNEVENRLFGRFAFEHATAYCYYAQEGAVGEVIRQAKFHDRPWLNTHLTRLFVQELAGSGWPYDVDVIVPVPLHWLRLLRRGYNQSVAIAEALHEAWSLPIEGRCLYKKHYTRSQVGLSGTERMNHEQGTFGVRNSERLRGRHVLLVDDVLTTGSTLTAAVDALREALPDLRISILTLALAR